MKQSERFAAEHGEAKRATALNGGTFLVANGVIGLLMGGFHVDQNKGFKKELILEWADDPLSGAFKWQCADLEEDCWIGLGAHRRNTF